MYAYQGSLEYSKSLPLVEKTMRATSASQSTEISCAFFSKPDLLLEKVTCLLILFSILFNCTLPLPISLTICIINLISYLFSSPKYQLFPLINASQSRTRMYICTYVRTLCSLAAFPQFLSLNFCMSAIVCSNLNV